MNGVRPWMRTLLIAIVGLAAAAMAWKTLGEHPDADAEDPADLLAAPRRTPVHAAPPTHGPQVAALETSSWTAGTPVRLPASDHPSGIFKARGWLPPPPPPAPAPPPPPPPVAVAAAPTMPPLPFVIIGRMDTGAGAPKVFINQRDSLQVVGVGDVIDSAYRIDALSGQSLTLTYLPTQQAVTLPVTGVPR